MSTIESLATLVGPAVAGLLLVVAGPATAFIVAAAADVASAALLPGIRTEPRPAHPHPVGLVHDALDGFRALASLLSRLPFFAPLPLATIEYLAGKLIPVETEAGKVVIREGDPGDVFFVIERGNLEVTVDGVTSGSSARATSSGRSLC